jgi:RNA polymerase sigma factor (TIGR02999 family)
MNQEDGRLDQADIEKCAQIESLLRNDVAQVMRLPRMLGLLHEDIRKIAHRTRMSIRASDTLSTTALMSEVYLKLQNYPLPKFNDRNHFFALIARSARQVIIDYARERKALKRGGGISLESINEESEWTQGIEEADQVLRLNNALERLEKSRPRLARVVMLRYFGGLSDSEIGDLCGVDGSTVRRDWQKASAWLYNDMR